MPASAVLARKSILAGMCCALMLAGCSSVRLPAFDPTGARIFAPAPSYTTLAEPPVLAGHPSCLPQPAFTAPPTPPPCNTPVAPPPGFGAPLAVAPPAVLGPPVAPKTSRLILTPSRVVAPIGGEVVLVAGLCGANGYFVKHEPIEWMLAPDGVGKIVEADDPDHQRIDAVFHDTPGKVTGAYAVSRGSSQGRLITRGTPDLTDDVRVQRGQTWISVTSPTAGVTHVTAVAAEAEQWDRRKQTATIYWVDAQWVLPPPAVASAGAPQVLTTTVTTTSGAPLPGWIVRYEMVGGAANLAGAADNAIDVATGADGRASVELSPMAAQSGVAQVRIQIIRPAAGSGEIPRLVVGQGWTTITWSAPGLALSASGPDAAEAGATIAYRAQIANTGDMAARNVVVSANLPDGVELLNSNPPAQIFGRRIEWRLGDLSAQTARDIELNCRSEMGGGLRLTFSASTDGGLSDNQTIATEIVTPSLEIAMDGPETVELGQEAHFRIEVINSGSQPLNNIVVRDAFPAGLAHVEGGTSPVEQIIASLAPGETRQIGLTFMTQQAGTLCHEVVAMADGGQAASARACVRITPPAAQPALDVEKTGPKTVRTGEEALFTITVRNTGEIALTNVRIIDLYPPELELREATAGNVPDPQQGQVAWTIASLAPGQVAVRQVKCAAAAAALEARSMVTVTSDQTGPQQAETILQIARADAPAAPDRTEVESDPMPPRAAPVGRLIVTIEETANPVAVGRATTFLILIENARNVEDRNVKLAVTLPASMSPTEISGPASWDRAASRDGVIVFQPIKMLRQEEKLAAFRITVTPRDAGKFTTKATVESLHSATPVEASTETTVTP